MPTAKLSPSPDRAARTIATCPTIKSDVIQTLRLKKEIIDQIHWCEHKLAVVIRIYKWTPEELIWIKDHLILKNKPGGKNNDRPRRTDKRV
jgi:hypothetical protein